MKAAPRMASCACRQHTQGMPYPRRLERVKFGVPLEEVCKRDIPGPLLVMLLKLNKEAPFKRAVFRAPGHQGSMKKLMHFLQQCRLVNIQNYSVNTIASVIKTFLRKIPGGIFGPENEAALFNMINMEDKDEQCSAAHRIIVSLPLYSQHLLVLLFGTFRVIAANSQAANTGMTEEALGVSVAPSFFHTCSQGKTATLEDVERFKHATKATSYFISNFGMRNLFGQENYEYYARLTGRILRLEDEWIYFTYPLEVIGTQDDLDISNRSLDVFTEKTGSLEIIPEYCHLSGEGRLSISLDDHAVPSPMELRSATMNRPKPRNAEIQSYSCLSNVHQRQAERIRARSDWFLHASNSTSLVSVRVKGDNGTPTRRPVSLQAQQSFSPTQTKKSSSSTLSDFTPVKEKPPLPQSPGGTVPFRENTTQNTKEPKENNKERKLVRRSSSKRKDKENGVGEKVAGQGGPALKRPSSRDSAINTTLPSCETDV